MKYRNDSAGAVIIAAVAVWILLLLAGALGWIGSFFQNIVSRRINSD